MEGGRLSESTSTINHHFGLRLPTLFFLIGSTPLLLVWAAAYINRPRNGRFTSETETAVRRFQKLNRHLDPEVV
jgi:hypothetical protein